jgi:hypothetical protein
MKTKKYCTRYYHAGDWWDAQIMAFDWEDAEARCKKLGMQLDGLHIATFPVWLGAWFPNLVIGVRNLFVKREV